jgi:hypothetical protein
MRPPGAGRGHAAASPPCPSTRRYRRPSRSSGGRNASADHARADDPRRGAPRGPRPSVTVKVAREAARLRPRPRGSVPRRVPRHAVANRPLPDAGRRSSLYGPRHRPSPLRRQRTGPEQGHALCPDSGAPECQCPDTRQIQCSTHTPGPMSSPFQSHLPTSYRQPSGYLLLPKAPGGNQGDDRTSGTAMNQPKHTTRVRPVTMTSVRPVLTTPHTAATDQQPTRPPRSP